MSAARGKRYRHVGYCIGVVCLGTLSACLWWLHSTWALSTANRLDRAGCVSAANALRDAIAQVSGPGERGLSALRDKLVSKAMHLRYSDDEVLEDAWQYVHLAAGAPSGEQLRKAAPRAVVCLTHRDAYSQAADLIVAIQSQWPEFRLHPRLNGQLCLAYSRLGRHQDTIRAFETRVLVHPELPAECLPAVAESYAALGEHQTLVHLLNRVVQSQADSALARSILDYRRWCRAQQGNPSPAAQPR